MCVFWAQWSAGSLCTAPSRSWGVGGHLKAGAGTGNLGRTRRRGRSADHFVDLPCRPAIGIFVGVLLLTDCIFCAIASGRLQSQTLYSDDQVVAFRDINPAAPVHFLVIPRAHIRSVCDLGPEHGPLLAAIHRVIARLAAQEGLDKLGFRVVTNHGEGGGQTVDHLHYHVLGGRELGWPPG